MECFVCINDENDNNNNNEQFQLDLAQSETSETNSSSISEVSGYTQSDLYCQNPTTDFNGEIVGFLDNFTVNQNSYKNMQLKNCKNVHLGKVTNIYGPVHINQTVQSVIQNKSSNKIFLEGTAKTVTAKRLNIVKRRNWLAQPPAGKLDHVDSPVQFVIIAHTDTKKAFMQAENVELIQNIQSYHMEKKNWLDIGYNFLIGCDGKVYEGRGWGTVGAHTYGYNKLGIGIAFIGCFMKELPTENALYQTKALIDQGVENGQLDRNYQLVGHCQCTETDSPGKALFEEIQTWDHWSNVISHNK